MTASILSLLFSFLTPVLMEYLKSKPWFPLIERGRPVLNAIMAACVAVGNVIGVSYAFEATTGTLTITGLVMDDMARLGVTAFLAWLLQELTYRVGVKRS